MAQIDIKKTTIRILDGRAATLTSDHTAAEADILYTAQPHIGSRLPTITHTDPGGNSQPLTITVTGYDIDISLATDGGGTITSTAQQVIDAINGDAAASALVVAATAPSNDGTGLVNALAQAPLATGPRALILKIGEGNITWTESQPRIYTKDAGRLDTVRDDDEEMVELRFDAIWEFLRASTGQPVTPTDALKNRGEAAAWVSSDTADPCQPYSVDLEIQYAPNCSPVEQEYYIFPKFRWETIEHDLRNGTLAFSGMCNVTEAKTSRAA